MFKIGDFSKINRVTIKALHLYDEMGLLKPQFVDKVNNYRFYGTEQFVTIQKIIALKQIGLSLSDIAILMQKDISSDEFIARLKLKEQEKRSEIKSEKDRLRQLQTLINTIQKEQNMQNLITTRDLPGAIVASMRKVVKNYDEFFTFWPAMGELMKAQDLKCSLPPYAFSIFHDGAYKEDSIDVEICEAVVTSGKDQEGMVFKTIPEVPKAACLIHKGPYSTLGKSYAILVRWIEENGYELADNMRESYHDGIWNQEDPNQWITEIQAPIRRK
jgi:DNA-binding transcriptional MerR regulator/effector-binding domain-containing protein